MVVGGTVVVVVVAGGTVVVEVGGGGGGGVVVVGGGSVVVGGGPDGGSAVAASDDGPTSVEAGETVDPVATIGPTGPFDGGDEAEPEGARSTAAEPDRDGTVGAVGERGPRRRLAAAMSGGGPRRTAHDELSS